MPKPKPRKELLRYSYRALTRSGRPVRGTIGAIDEVHLHNQLSEAGFELISSREACRICETSFLKKFFTKVKMRDLIMFLIQMEQMHTAGTPLLSTLKSTASMTGNQKLRDIIMGMKRDLHDGFSLSDAMKCYPDVFSKLHIAIVIAGEESGDLGVAYRFLISFLKWSDAMQRRVRKATRYPIMVLSIVVISLVVMMGVVVPQITSFFEYIGDGKELPFMTRALLATSAFFQAYWWMVLGSIAGAMLTFVVGRRISETFAHKTDGMILKVPVYGSLVRKLSIARFVQTMGALYRAKLPLIEAINISQDTVNNRVIKEAIAKSRTALQEGATLSGALTATGEFPEMVPMMIMSGEETGKMSEVLEQISEFYNADVDEEVSKMIAMIEPALTAIMGGMILWIAVAVFGPIYDLFEDLDA
jgi:type IV pilus assembly protein PilC